jgi:hypothetical protein
MCSFMQLRNCFDEGMLWFWCVSLLMLFMTLFWLFVSFVELLGLVNVFFYCLWDYFGYLCLAIGHWSGYASTGPLGAWVDTKDTNNPLRACVNVADCCDPSSAGTLTYIKSLETYVESVFATLFEWFAIADHFSFGLVRMIRLSAMHQVT